MRKIFNDIINLNEGTEKDFLLKTYYSTEKYIKRKDQQSLEIIISRLNGLYEGMTDSGKKITLQLVKEIMEAMGRV